MSCDRKKHPSNHHRKAERRVVTKSSFYRCMGRHCLVNSKCAIVKLKKTLPFFLFCLVLRDTRRTRLEVDSVRSRPRETRCLAGGGPFPTCLPPDLVWGPLCTGGTRLRHVACTAQRGAVPFRTEKEESDGSCGRGDA